jgi:hypothetical protein
MAQTDTLADCINELGHPLAAVSLPSGGAIAVYPDRIVPLGDVPLSMEYASLGHAEHERRTR